MKKAREMNKDKSYLSTGTVATVYTAGPRMDKREILEFIKRNPVAYMATLDISGRKPHVRAMRTYWADEDGIIFNMETPKDVYKELLKNPEVELCYFASGVQLRISGRMEELTDPALKRVHAINRPILQPGVAKKGLDYIGIFILRHGKATVLRPPLPTPGSLKVYIDL
jgi:uncharacterized pyridoxamine 5'-phosphate oxidase family protein